MWNDWIPDCSCPICALNEIFLLECPKCHYDSYCPRCNICDYCGEDTLHWYNLIIYVPHEDI